eukprot:CAMPEP_0168357222 /NCGR_PEP_ID=MMETSP0228-20121227/474_1 /TAXON_ID=133427 /ORGANISM="Protoceratium reticulatum, Strain CCCM 535 (=CCMP 1889)" /LENGTH=138 /DNA_ID=CAMNT_0008369731 /DNA_START=193 /DNA_END=607 /DNA_ORIENTATION=+
MNASAEVWPVKNYMSSSTQSFHFHASSDGWSAGYPLSHVADHELRELRLLLVARRLALPSRAHHPAAVEAGAEAEQRQRPRREAGDFCPAHAAAALQRGRRLDVVAPEVSFAHRLPHDDGVQEDPRGAALQDLERRPD